MGQLMRLCAEMDWPSGSVARRIAEWEGDVSPAAQSVPLRLAGALHALHLQGYAGLRSAYPPIQPSDQVLWDAVTTAFDEKSADIHSWLNSAPQTNEVRRAATLIAVGHVLAARYGLPLRTSELGASGGLNLHWDDYALHIGDARFGAKDTALILRPDWTGPLPSVAAPVIASRAGVDLNPLDPARPEDALRLQAYLWPDQPDRLALTRAAIKAARSPVAKGDAVDWLAQRMTQKTGEVHLIYSTVAWQYFPTEKQAQGRAMIAAAGACATDDSPLAWFGMENDNAGNGAALTLRLWPGDIMLNLGRADFHGRWINWSGVA